MKKFLSSILLSFTLLAIASCAHSKQNPITANKSAKDSVENCADNNLNNTQIPVYARRLIKAYPEQKMRYAGNSICFPDGTSIIYDDKKTKDFTKMLDDSDIEDMFSIPYDTIGKPKYLADAGRSRCDALFKKMYGASAEAVRKNLVTVEWFGQKILFTKVNGADKQLQKVAAELANIPSMRNYLKSSGTFYWRKVRGANRQSAHSYGIAFDIGVDHSNYWLWSNPGAKETDKIKYVNRIPKEIVKVFEKHGFIWGGRWYHYDTMHFEYRPELID